MGVVMALIKKAVKNKIMKNNYRIALNKAHNGVQHRKRKGQEGVEKGMMSTPPTATPFIPNIAPPPPTQSIIPGGGAANIDLRPGANTQGQHLNMSIDEINALGSGMRDNSYASVEPRTAMGNLGVRLGNVFRSSENDIDPNAYIRNHDGSKSSMSKGTTSSYYKNGGSNNYKQALKAFKNGGSKK